MKESGKGFGMKNSFKEMYKAQKEEFYTTEPAKIKVTPKDRTEWAKNNLHKWKKIDTDYRETLKEIEKSKHEGDWDRASWLEYTLRNSWWGYKRYGEKRYERR